MSDKLHSQKGVSILFALLLLLVCVCVGSVVLAAGTAAAGRHAVQASNDSRYYSVLSASDTLKYLLMTKPVTLTRTHKQDITQVFDVLIDGKDITEEKEDKSQKVMDDSYSLKFSVGGIETECSVSDVLNQRGVDFCLDLILDSLFGTVFSDTRTFGKEQYDTVLTGATIENQTVDWTLETDDKELPSPVISYSMEASGNIIFLTFSIQAGEGQNIYAVDANYQITMVESTTTKSNSEPDVYEEQADGSIIKTKKSQIIEEKTDEFRVEFKGLSAA